MNKQLEYNQRIIYVLFVLSRIKNLAISLEEEEEEKFCTLALGLAENNMYTYIGGRNFLLTFNLGWPKSYTKNN